MSPGKLSAGLTPTLLRFALALTLGFSGLERVVRGPAYATAYFSSLGIAWPDVLGPVISWLELIAGVALAIGAATRVAAIIVLADMMVALVVVRLPQASTAPSLTDAVLAVRFEVVLAAAAASVAILGAGPLSVDRAFAGWRTRVRPHTDAAVTRR